MAATMTVNARALGRRSPLLPDWSVPFPPELGDGGPVRLRELIAQIVRNEVTAFIDRQHRQRFIQVLSESQVDQAVSRGAIRSSGSEVPDQPVDSNAAISTAIQAFEDGLFLIILDGEEQRALEREVFIKPGCRITFLRLTLLAGG